MRSIDHLDDLIEDKMREAYAKSIEGPSKLVNEFVYTQTISDLHAKTIVSKDTWESSSDASLEIKPKSKGIFKSAKIGKNVRAILKIEDQYKQ